MKDILEFARTVATVLGGVVVFLGAATLITEIWM